MYRRLSGPKWREWIIDTSCLLVFLDFTKIQQSVVGFDCRDINAQLAFLNTETSEPSFFPLAHQHCAFHILSAYVLMLFKQENCPLVEHLSPTPKLNRVLNICKIPHTLIL